MAGDEGEASARFGWASARFSELRPALGTTAFGKLSLRQLPAATKEALGDAFRVVSMKLAQRSRGGMAYPVHEGGSKPEASWRETACHRKVCRGCRKGAVPDAIGYRYQVQNITPPDLLELIYETNEVRYGNKLGATYEWLRAHGKTDLDIIESASRPIGDIKAVGQLIYRTLGEKAVPVLEKYGML